MIKVCCSSGPDWDQSLLADICLYMEQKYGIYNSYTFKMIDHEICKIFLASFNRNWIPIYISTRKEINPYNYQITFNFEDKRSNVVFNLVKR